MTRIFADVSSNQASVNLREYAAAGHLAIALKATEGETFTDPDYGERVQEAHRLGLAVIHYHFARPDRHLTPHFEAQHFTETVRPLFHALDAVAWDQEVSGMGQSAAHLARYANQAHADLYARRHRRSLGYSYLAYIDAMGGHWPWPARRTWLADYLRLHRPPLGRWTYAHQFTDGRVGPEPHSAAGIGPCDLSYLNRRAYRRLARRRFRAK